MVRIFITLSLFAVLFLAVTLVIGLSIGELNLHSDQSTKSLATIHRLFGVAAALVVVFVNSIVVTYFVGTSRWCKEVIETYSLDRSLLVRSVQLKRAAFPWAVLGMLTVVGIAALGGAADPGGRGLEAAQRWITPHLIGALGGIALVLLVFWMEGQKILANHAVINDILAEVARIRRERGLDD